LGLPLRVVFRARQLALRRLVALQAIAPGLVDDEEYRERFVREAHLAASIEHPNVIPTDAAALGSADPTVPGFVSGLLSARFVDVLLDLGGRRVSRRAPVLRAGHRRVCGAAGRAFTG
jgi:serine/threonine protein kinase